MDGFASFISNTLCRLNNTICWQDRKYSERRKKRALKASSGICFCIWNVLIKRSQTHTTSGNFSSKSQNPQASDFLNGRVLTFLVGISGTWARLKQNATYSLRKITVKWIMAAQGTCYLFLQLAEKSCFKTHLKHQFYCHRKASVVFGSTTVL